MDAVILWKQILAPIQPRYPKAQNGTQGTDSIRETEIKALNKVGF
jgi:hypothetical protein